MNSKKSSLNNTKDGNANHSNSTGSSTVSLSVANINSSFDKLTTKSFNMYGQNSNILSTTTGSHSTRAGSLGKKNGSEKNSSGNSSFHKLNALDIRPMAINKQHLL
jgi:hypothetical protein